MNWKTIVNTGIQKGSTNGSRTFEEIFVNEKNEKFRITIRSESYVPQSYARLSKWSEEKGWLVIHSKNPKRDYDIDISYHETFSVHSFDPIIYDLKKVAEIF